MAWLTPRHTPFPTFYLVERERSALKVVVIDRGEPQKLENPGLHPFGTGTWLNPKTNLFPYIYHVTFGSSVSKDVRTKKREPKKIGERRVPAP